MFTKPRDSMLVLVLSLVLATIVLSAPEAGAFTYTYNDGLFSGSFHVTGTNVDPTTGLLNSNANPLINQQYTLASISQPWTSTGALTVDSFLISGAGYTFSMATDPSPHFDSVSITVNHAGQIIDWNWTIYDGAWPNNTLAYLVLYGGPDNVGNGHPRPDQENLYILKPTYDPQRYTNTATWTGTPDQSPPAVPEPATSLLMGVGLLGLAIYSKRRLS